MSTGREPGCCRYWSWQGDRRVAFLHFLCRFFSRLFLDADELVLGDTASLAGLDELILGDSASPVSFAPSCKESLPGLCFNLPHRSQRTAAMPSEVTVLPQPSWGWYCGSSLLSLSSASTTSPWPSVKPAPSPGQRTRSQQHANDKLGVPPRALSAREGLRGGNRMRGAVRGGSQLWLLSNLSQNFNG